MPVNVQEALDLRVNHNLSYKKIAKLQSVTPAAIYKQIKDLLPAESTQIYTDHKADVLARMQERILTSVTLDDLKKAPLGSKILAVAQLIDKERLERGQATSIADSQIRVLLDMVTGQNRQDADVIDAETAEDAEIREGLKAIPLKEDSNIK